ncbi:MAG: RecQ family ATP-dependent DNA helicase [Desulfobacteraceae bacterium]|nr:RecQ family ATP-dependent DNA helicase [Desulfobacteraceae bacterium]
MAEATTDIENDILFLDLEVDPGGRIYHMGAVTGSAIFERRGRFDRAEALNALDQFCRDARYIAGHNILYHDLPVIQAGFPGLELLKKPVIDTLFLSPLAFPENPYHRLVKDYKLVKESLNDPVADARLSQRVLLEQMERFQAQEKQVLSFYRSCFHDARLGDFDGRGTAGIFKRVGGDELLEPDDAMAVFIELTQGKICTSGLEEIFVLNFLAPEHRVVLAYTLAWIRVSGGNSVIPAWVRKRFPRIIGIVARLRDFHCGRDDCSYCRETHDPERHLDRYFGFDGFRNLPDGTPLQKEIVTAGMAGKPLLGILPTGGGKSVCFQVPALAGFFRTGALTVVISPLQALMKDQVENLNRATGSETAAFINGMLTPPERGYVMDRVRMGDIALLYLSPEQLRNRSVGVLLGSREVRCFVFDEAHCLSKWGHDFRTDYLYASMFIRNYSDREKTYPTVACFTATAKTDVIHEILAHFKAELGLGLTLFEGGVERNNLHFEVHAVTGHEKNEALAALLTTRLSTETPGCAIVYRATRKKTEQLSEYLNLKGHKTRFFHAGMTVPEKREVQEGFVAGEIPVIVATNAFGMGIDKDNVRLVIHADIPGSVENYLQEAGRAGRDNQEAQCILLYDENDIEEQFRLTASSRLTTRDIAQILKGIRRAKQNQEGEIIITAGEILRDEAVNTEFDQSSRDYETRVRTAISWLERGGFLSRKENVTSVFQGRPRFASMEEAGQAIQRLNLSRKRREIWETILTALMNAPRDQGMSADQICESLGMLGDLPEEYNSTKKVIATMNDMAGAGIIHRTMMLTAWLTPGGRNSAQKRLEKVCILEKAMISVMEEEYPMADPDERVRLTFRALNQKLLTLGHTNASVQFIRQALKTLQADGKGFGNSFPSIEIHFQDRETCCLRMRRGWDQIKTISGRRHELARLLLGAILEKAGNARGKKGEILVEFSYDTITDYLAGTITTMEIRPEKMLAAMEAGLLFLHDNKVISLQQGMAVFRQAMTLKLNPVRKKQRYTRADFQPLFHHYGQRIFQIHIMNEFARMGTEKIRQALAMIISYFSMDSPAFLRRYFPGRKGMLERATSEESFKKIVSGLNHPDQERIVSSDARKNVLVLAGPGSGKTRTVVHRCAWLLRVKRVPPGSVLMLCYNHNAATLIRKRLFALAGTDARGVSVMTFHGLALNITGRALEGTDRDLSAWFEGIIVEAGDILSGKKELPGLAPDEIRDRILAGYEYILVDEYQDIDQAQYDLISAVAGRTLKDKGGKLAIMAVGDDDQSIYGFRNASVRFIRKFKEDYNAAVFHLTDNFRSGKDLIELSNTLIRANTDRMKTGFPIRPASKVEKGGGEIRCYLAQSHLHQAGILCHEIRGLKGEGERKKLDYSRVAVLSRNGMDHDMLAFARSLLEREGIPVSIPLPRSSSFSPFKIRETAEYLAMLLERQDDLSRASVLMDEYGESLAGPPNTWQELILEGLSSFQSETGDAEVYLYQAHRFLARLLAEQKREQRLGTGVFLGTVHSAKGLEFSHVFILDGGWGSPVKKQEMEEERRLYYVAMTRAKGFLGLFRLAHLCNPHLAILDRAHDLTFVSPPVRQDAKAPSLLAHRIIGFKELFLDFAGRCRPSHPVHTALKGLNAGDGLGLDFVNARLCLVTPAGTIVAALAAGAHEEWGRLLPRVRQARVIAMVTRRRSDCSGGFEEKILCDAWEIPIVEVGLASA